MIKLLIFSKHWFTILKKKKQSVIQSVSEISVPAGIDQTLSKLCDLFDGEV